jgi:hypothetical protein
MMALHLPYHAVGTWKDTMNANDLTAIQAPLNVGCTKPAGYTPSWAHKPLPGVQSYFMYKNKVALFPQHNAWKMQVLDPKSDWRGLWADLSLLKPSVFGKTNEEIRYNPKDTANNVPESTPDLEKVMGPEGEVILAHVQKANLKVARSRLNHLRKEQLSQGVLNRILQTLGRFSIQEVIQTQPHHLTI